jgi:protein-tyrosine-phosphatase
MAFGPLPPPTPLVLDRRAILAGVGLALAGGPAKAACRPVRVLFVCPAGSVKSAIAREVLKRRAAQEGVSVVVASRGLRLEDHVTPALAANLRGDGIDPTAEPLRALTPADVAQADILVAFDEASEAPLLRSAQAWKTPSWNADYAAAKADLEARLTVLLKQIRARAAATCEALYSSGAGRGSGGLG